MYTKAHWTDKVSIKKQHENNIQISKDGTEVEIFASYLKNY